MRFANDESNSQVPVECSANYSKHSISWEKLGNFLRLEQLVRVKDARDFIMRQLGRIWSLVQLLSSHTPSFSRRLTESWTTILCMFCQKIIQFNNKQQNSSKFNLKTVRTQCWCGNVLQTLYTLLWIPHWLGENSLMCLYVVVGHHRYPKMVGFIHITHMHTIPPGRTGPD